MKFRIASVLLLVTSCVSAQDRWLDPRPLIVQAIEELGIKPYLEVGEASYTLRGRVVARELRVDNKAQAGYRLQDLLRLAQLIESKAPQLRVLRFEAGWRDEDCWRPGKGFLVAGTLEDATGLPALVPVLSDLAALQQAVGIESFDRVTIENGKAVLRVERHKRAELITHAKEKLGLRVLNERERMSSTALILSRPASETSTKSTPAQLEFCIEGLARVHGLKGVRSMPLRSQGEIIRFRAAPEQLLSQDQLSRFVDRLFDPRFGMRVEELRLKRADGGWNIDSAPFLGVAVAETKASGPTGDQLPALLKQATQGGLLEGVTSIAAKGPLTTFDLPDLDDAKTIGQKLVRNGTAWERVFLIAKRGETYRLLLSRAPAHRVQGDTDPFVLIIDDAKALQSVIRLQRETGQLHIDIEGSTKNEAQKRAERFVTLLGLKQASLKIAGSEGKHLAQLRLLLP